MLLFALFTVGYFFGVFTALLVFPPRVKEIQEQEKDALSPIINIKVEKQLTEVSNGEQIFIPSN